MKEGTGIDGSSLGFLHTEQSDMKIVPDFQTFSQLPWNNRIGRFICDITDNKGVNYPLCPRGILKKVLLHANSLGYEYLIRPELEWYFLHSENKPADIGSYMDLPPKDSFHELRRQIVDDMIEMGIGIKIIHHEVGPGQHEIEFLPDKALVQADNVQTAKTLIRINSFYEDIISTFLPKPIAEEAGSGLHIHQYLLKDRNNVFADEEKGISDILRYFIGGIQKHVDGISAILNPITNSYKRLVPNNEAPVYTSWGVGNRTALLRVPGYENSARIEYRASDAAMNIYLGTAVLLATGLDGIMKKIEPNEPVNEDLAHFSKEKLEKLGIKILPRSLTESINSLEKDQYLKDVLGEKFVNLYLKIKRNEIKEFENSKLNGTESEWEFDKYLMI
jgi:glutamine synthetase